MMYAFAGDYGGAAALASELCYSSVYAIPEYFGCQHEISSLSWDIEGHKI